MLGRLLGEVLSLPVKVANVPLTIADYGLDRASGGDGDRRILSFPGEVVSDAIEDVCDSLDTKKDEWDE